MVGTLVVRQRITGRLDGRLVRATQFSLDDVVDQ